MVERLFRLNDHPVYGVLHWVKPSSKEPDLDEIKDCDCFSRKPLRL